MTRYGGRTARNSVALSFLVMTFAFALAQPASAQSPAALQRFREQYDLAMANFQRVSDANKDAKGSQRAADGRAAMQALTDLQLANLFSKTRLPDFSVVSMAAGYLASQAESASPSSAPRVAAPMLLTPSTPFPVADAVDSHCDGVDVTPGTRYTQLIAKETTNAILAAAAWVCNEDILGENGSAACVPLAIAADIANGFYDTSAWCSGESQSNAVDANYRRLEHIHNDLGDAVTAIVNNANANTTTIVDNSNTNTTTLLTNENNNRTQIINNDNANTSLIINNANANKNELRDLILRTQIEQDLSAPDSGAVVALFETPTAQGGYLNLVAQIVADTIAKVQAAGGATGNAQQFLNAGNAAKAAGNFKDAYANYRKAYKAAGK